ncbi:MAG: class I SAM-dependent methyltransferase [Burkholderiales bacterium]
MSRGWFKMPRRPGDRTLAEQILALAPALAECCGKTVLDLGCAEGLISLEFAKAGAIRVLGIDREEFHLEVANKLGYAGPCVLKFKQWDLNKADPATSLSYDIVLCLGIIHKLGLPGRGLMFAARSAKTLLLLRSGRGSVDGIIRGKHSGRTCDSAAVMRAEGFVLEKTIDGPVGRDEPVEFWRRAP